MHDFKELRVWNRSMDMVSQVYKLLNGMPITEQFGLTSQMRRCSVSIASNVAEGSGRFSSKDFQRFLSMAYGSCNELETQLILSNRLGYLEEYMTTPIVNDLNDLRKMIYRLRKSMDN
jgi:four helix bundle protein